MRTFKEKQLGHEMLGKLLKNKETKVVIADMPKRKFDLTTKSNRLLEGQLKVTHDKEYKAALVKELDRRVRK